MHYLMIGFLVGIGWKAGTLLWTIVVKATVKAIEAKQEANDRKKAKRKAYIYSL